MDRCYWKMYREACRLAKADGSKVLTADYIREAMEGEHGRRYREINARLTRRYRRTPEGKARRARWWASRGEIAKEAHRAYARRYMRKRRATQS